MIDRVVISPRAQRDLARAPRHIVEKIGLWIEAVETDGLQATRKIPGYHDEPLRGHRQGQRSIRLSRAYRAIYVIASDGRVEFVSIEEVSKHDY